MERWSMPRLTGWPWTAEPQQLRRLVERILDVLDLRGGEGVWCAVGEGDRADDWRPGYVFGDAGVLLCWVSTHRSR